MLHTMSILSADQGRLTNRPQTEDAFYARFSAPVPVDRQGTESARPAALPAGPARSLWRNWLRP